MATPIFEEKGIDLQLLAGIDSIDAERKVVITDAMEEYSYDLLICVPPHKGAQVVIDSGLAPKSGWVPTDRYTLQVKKMAAPGTKDEDVERYPNIHALGDATDLPLSKAGSTAHFEAPIVAERVAAGVLGRRPSGKHALYTGKVMCFFEVGDGKGTILSFDYDNPPEAAQAEPALAPGQDRLQQDLLADRPQGPRLGPGRRRRQTHLRRRLARRRVERRDRPGRSRIPIGPSRGYPARMLGGGRRLRDHLGLASLRRAVAPRFDDPEQEAAFCRDRARETTPMIRSGFIVGVAHVDRDRRRSCRWRRRWTRRSCMPPSSLMVAIDVGLLLPRARRAVAGAHRRRRDRRHGRQLGRDPGPGHQRRETASSTPSRA